MTRSILCGLLALLSVGALGVVPLACQSGGVGDPCTPEDEYNTQFGGFKVEQENIESRSFQCQTRICLVNHFQGRASCPAGQAAPKQCNPANKGSECNGGSCVLAQTYAPACTPCDPADSTCIDTCKAAGFADACDPSYNYCGCKASQPMGGVQFYCEAATTCATGNCPLVLNSYVCHKPGVENCQTAPNTNESLADAVTRNKGKDCCVPGGDVPVAVSVCGQCDSTSKRNADQAVYCSCRCCVPCCPAGTTPDQADAQGCSNDTSICGPACDPNFNYCSCPGGYTCTGIRTNVGLGDPQLAGAYCIKSGTAFTTTSVAMCGAGALGGYVGDNSCAP